MGGSVQLNSLQSSSLASFLRVLLDIRQLTLLNMILMDFHQTIQQDLTEHRQRIKCVYTLNSITFLNTQLIKQSIYELQILYLFEYLASGVLALWSKD